jgi:chromosome segregation ATPase
MKEQRELQTLLDQLERHIREQAEQIDSLQKTVEALAVACEQANVKLKVSAQPEPKLSDAGADTNISRGLEPKGSGWVTLNQVGMRVDLKDAPPRKPWQGLTDDEKTEIFMQAEFNDLTERQMYDVVEAKLKDKNDTI